MGTNGRKLAIAGAVALTLAIAGATVAGAHDDGRGMGPGDGSGQGFGRPGGEMHHGRGMGPGGFFGERGMGRGPIGDRIREGIGEHLDILVRTETILDLGEDGFRVERMEHGTVTSVTETALVFTLATGEEVSVTVDADTDVFDLDPEARPIRDEIAVTEIAAGADVLVASEQQADGSFLAKNVRVLPELAAPTDDAAVTPEASPAAQG